MTRTSFGFRWWLFKLWCWIGWKICPPEHRLPLQNYMKIVGLEFDHVEAYLNGVNSLPPSLDNDK